MNRRKFFVLLALVALAFLPAAGAAERWKVLKAINWVENPTNHGRFGPKGELGPYQFRASTWREYSDMPFSYAVNREHADAVAVRHYEWIKRGLTAAGIDPNPYNIALVWNSGLSAVTSGRVPKSTYRYADQVRNLVEVLQRRAPAPAAVAAAPVESVKPIAVPVINISGDATPVVFAAVPSSAPRFVLGEDASAEMIPVIRTDRSLPVQPVTAPAPQSDSQPLFVATALGAPRFTLVD